MSFGRRLSRLAVRTVGTRVFTPRSARPLVSFTFDDVPETAFTCGAALLERHGARGTFYISGSLVGTVEPDRRLIDGEQIASLHRRGHEIGCHTFSHRHVATMDANDLDADIARNQAFFAGLDPTIKPRNFAYPYNATSLPAKFRVQTRFGSCRGGHAGVNAGRVDLGFLRAVELCDDIIDLGRVRAWVAEAARRAGWLVFLTHGVTEEREPWRSTPGLFEGAIEAARALGCEIVTMREALGRLGASTAAAETPRA